MGPLIGTLRLILFLIFTGIAIPVQGFLHAFKLPYQRVFPSIFNKMVSRYVLNIKVTRIGEVSRQKPTLFLSNHLSYLDIPTLGSLIKGVFVAKLEVADWPIFGLLAKLQDTVFIERKGRLTHGQSNAMQQAFEIMDYMILFPEGTSSEGVTVLPFKSSLLQAAFGELHDKIMIQPVAIACRHDGGRPGLYPWYGDMTLPPHLWQIVQMNGFEVCITFLPPVPASQFSDRKALAQYAYKAVLAAPHGVIKP